MGKTTITVEESTLERFKTIKQEADDAEPDLPDVNADYFLNSLLDTWEKVGKVGYGNQADVTLGDGYEEIAERIAAAIDYPVADVKEAVREVIREEFPEGALR